MGKLKELIKSKDSAVVEVPDKLLQGVVYRVRPVSPFLLFKILRKHGLTEERREIDPDKLESLHSELLRLGVEDWEDELKDLVPHMILPLTEKILEISGLGERFFQRGA